MRIGLVRRGYSSTGGAESYLKRFAAALVQAGHECVLFASPQWPAQDWAHGDNRTVKGTSPRQFADSLRLLQPRRECDFLFSLERVWNCDCFRAGDGVHRAWLQRRARYEPRWKSFLRQFNGKHRELLELESHLLTAQGPGVIIANSKMVKAEIIEHSSYPPERIQVIYNGFESKPDGHCLDGRHASDGTPGAYAAYRTAGKTVFLFGGSGWERKGLKFAIQGFKQANLPNSVLLVAGRGNPKKVPHADNVHFLGPVNDFNQVLAAADVFILPTLYDPFSNACLEALAAGLPVITTTANGMSEIIRPGVDGAAVEEPSDEAAVARAIVNWSDKEKRDATRVQRIEWARSFSIESNLEQTLKAMLKAKGFKGNAEG